MRKETTWRWRPRPKPNIVPVNAPVTNDSNHPGAWLFLNSSSSSVQPSAAIVATRENPHSPLPLPTCYSAHLLSIKEFMAFQWADRAPFIPGHLQYEDVPNREFMTRAVAPIRPPARNENLAIVTFDPLPGNPMSFAAVRSVLRDFLQLEKRVQFLDIQLTHLGQALVRLTHTYTRDALVEESPHPFDNVNVTFTKHDQGRNWRRAELNHECWLLLLGFPSDYLSERHITQAVGKFARVLLFEADERYLARVLVRARVKDVTKVPQFVVYEDPDIVDGESWTIQCEVLQHKPP